MKRVLSGMRPTGKLHLGHWVGALENWVSLQDKYQCFYAIVDWHALTTDYDRTEKIRENIIEIAADWLAAGIDPGKSTILLQSLVKQHAELHLLLSMIIPLGWLLRVPTYKEQMRQLSDRDLHTYGFLGYPVLQTADIIIYKAELVPVGEDQKFHIELAREIVRRFNHFYGDVFPEPKEILTPVPKILGTDGRKMSKSYGNAIFMEDSPEELKKKIFPMVTDTRRKRRSDPGKPEDCPVWTLHKAFTPEERRKELYEGCTRATIGCLDCKKVLLEELSTRFQDFREKKNYYMKRKDEVVDIILEGSKKARQVAEQTLEEVREVMGVGISPGRI